MTTRKNPVEEVRVACEVCQKEVPRSEAVVPEATDYVLYVCGLDCYEKWKSQGGKAVNDEQSQRVKDQKLGGNE